MPFGSQALSSLRTLGLAGLVGLAGLLGLGCGGEEGPPPFDDVLGGAGWANGDVSCDVDNPCGAGEVCVEGVCQMQRCTSDYKSKAPLNPGQMFGSDLELLVVSDQKFVDGYESNAGYVGSWEEDEPAIIGVDGGNLLGKRPHAIATAFEGQRKVKITQGKSVRTIDVGLVPRAIAVGDVDADGKDELLALSKDGTLAVCDVAADKCKEYPFENVEGKDVAVGDVDADGYGEPVMILRAGGKDNVVVFNLDAQKTGQEKTKSWSWDGSLRAISAGNLNPGADEVVVLQDGSSSDRVHIFRPVNGEHVTSFSVPAGSVDVSVGDFNMDRGAEMAVLRSDASVEIFRYEGSGKVSSLGAKSLSVGGAASRIATFDIDNDSPRGRLLEAPFLVAGDTVPIAAMVFPPYMYGKSDGHSEVFMGRSQSESVSVSETVSLSAGVTVGYGAEIPGFKASVEASVRTSLSETKTLGVSTRVAQTYAAKAAPESYGFDYAAVVLACACFHTYHYRTDDPAGRLGEDGQDIYVFVPVGGDTALWSSTRYNALAKRIGLPEIDVKARIGDVASYPREPQTLSGGRLDASDLLFTKQPEVQASDIGVSSWSQTVSATATNSVNLTTEIGVTGTLGAFGATVSGNITWGKGEGYSISVGKDTTFGGSIPPVPDDPTTPEDEYAAYRYSFVPFVYRQGYETTAGEDAAFYVMTYAAGQ